MLLFWLVKKLSRQMTCTDAQPMKSEHAVEAEFRADLLPHLVPLVDESAAYMRTEEASTPRNEYAVELGGLLTHC